MQIRFMSSLSSEEEDTLAPVVLAAAGALLDEIPLNYALRIETTSNRVYQRQHRQFPSGGPVNDTDQRTSSSHPPMKRTRS